MKKIIKAVVLAALTISGGASASEWCTEGHPDYQRFDSEIISINTGCLPRPILFVHGGGVNQEFWGALELFNVEIPIIGEINMLQLKRGMAAFDMLNHFGITEFDNSNYEFEGFENVDPKVALFPKSYKYFFFDAKRVDQSKQVVVEQSEQLYDHIEELLNEFYGQEWKSNPDAKVDLIGHSQGGLVIRYLINNNRNTSLENPVNHINSIITAGTPHLGTSLATENSSISSINGLRADLDWFTSQNWVNALGDLQTMYTNIINASEHLAIGSSFQKNLQMFRYPTLPLDNSKIPMVALYSIAPGLGAILADAEIVQSAIACKKRDLELEVDYGCGGPWYEELLCETGEVVTDFGGDIAEFGTDIFLTLGHSIAEEEFDIYTIEDVDKWVCKTAEDVLDAVEDLSQSRLKHEYFDEMELDWFPYSDGLVDVFSQKGEGLFYENSDPFLTIDLNEYTGVDRISHGNVFGSKGPESFGSAFIEAYRIMPEAMSYNVVPTIIAPLLLN